jgi:hypothetical protein
LVWTGLGRESRCGYRGALLVRMVCADLLEGQRKIGVIVHGPLVL